MSGFVRRGSALKRKKDALDGLTPGQRESVRTIFTDRASLFVTGSAGTGKSHLIGLLSPLCPRNLTLTLSASTGIAARNITGITLHSFLGLQSTFTHKHASAIAQLSLIQTAQDPKSTHFDDDTHTTAVETLHEVCLKIVANRECIRRIKSTDILVVDEISMVSSQFLDAMDNILKFIRKSTDVFGGIQVVFFGDFLQLPPVGCGSKVGWAFESAVWFKSIEVVIELTETVRQTQDKSFALALMDIRKGLLDTYHVKRMFDACMVTGRRAEQQTVPIHLYATNRQTNEKNAELLRQFTGQHVSLTNNETVDQKAEDKNDKNDQPLQNSSFDVNPELSNVHQFLAVDDVSEFGNHRCTGGVNNTIPPTTNMDLEKLAPGVINLASGQPIVFTRTTTMCRLRSSVGLRAPTATGAPTLIANGTQAVVTKFVKVQSKKKHTIGVVSPQQERLSEYLAKSCVLPVISVNDSPEPSSEFVCYPIEWSDNDNSMSRWQLPIRPSWALTVHRSQGLTLPATNVSIDRFFAPGQLYVALSRVRSSADLTITFSGRSQMFRNCLKTDPKALMYYNNLNGGS